MGRLKGSRNRLHKLVSNNGYLCLFLPNHPEAMRNGYVRVHRMVMADHLGRKLLPTEEVHHKDGNPTNNDLSNLELIDGGEHTRLHKKGKPLPRRNAKLCWFQSCETLTGSKYGLCTKHYRLQWGRLKHGRIQSIHENPDLLPSS